MNRWPLLVLVALGACGSDPSVSDAPGGDDAGASADAGAGASADAASPEDAGQADAADARADAAGADAGLPECPAYEGAAVQVGKNPATLKELSGLAASRLHPGIFWAHNDSGNALELYAIQQTGAVVATLTLTGATGIDVEDVAVGPCTAGAATSCVYLADIGDNPSTRPSIAVYKLPEPTALQDASVAVAVSTFTYPDGAHNAESFVVAPDGSAQYVLTKHAANLGDVYKLVPGAGGAVGTSVKIATVSAGDSTSTGADAHRLGHRILIRSYTKAWELRAPGAASFDDVWKATPLQVPGALQLQSEAIAYTHDGRGYLLGTELNQQPLLRVDCKP
jgi:hypothetical protein